MTDSVRFDWRERDADLDRAVASYWRRRTHAGGGQKSEPTGGDDPPSHARKISHSIKVLPGGAFFPPDPTEEELQ